MHATWESARDYCERRRVQGTVFYINELPALTFVAGERALVVTEINTDDILSRFDFGKLTNLTSILPVSTMTLRQMYHVFKPTSSLWPNAYPREDSAILLFGTIAPLLIACSASASLTAKASRAVGANYHLNWSERPFTIKFSAVSGLANSLAERFGES